MTAVPNYAPAPPRRTTYGEAVSVIARVTRIPLVAIKRDSNPFLAIDIERSLLGNVLEALEDHFGIRMPIEEWKRKAEADAADAERYFKLGNLCDRIDEIMAAQAATARDEPAPRKAVRGWLRLAWPPQAASGQLHK
jgi:hypothetical protein